MLIRDRSEGESPDQECPKDIPRLSGLTDEQPLPVPQPFTDFLLGSPRVKAADPARGLYSKSSSVATRRQPSRLTR